MRDYPSDLAIQPAVRIGLMAVQPPVVVGRVHLLDCSDNAFRIHTMPLLSRPRYRSRTRIWMIDQRPNKPTAV